MEVSSPSKGSIKIKGKKSSIILNPEGIKVSAEVVALLNKFSKFEASKIEGLRLVVKGPGEYEASGIKVSAERVVEDLIYNFTIDGLEILWGKSDSLEKASADKSNLVEAKDYQIMIIDSATALNQSIITKIEPKAVVLYGEKASEIAKDLGKEGLSSVPKYSTTLEKLPEEMEVFLLG